MTFVQNFLKIAVIFTVFIYTVLYCHTIRAQNLYDLEHTLRFAQYLYNTQQYTLASQEFERAVFLDSANTKAQLYLIKSYRKAGETTSGLYVLQRFWGDSLLHLPKEFADEYIKLLVDARQFSKADSYLQNNHNTSYVRKKEYETAFYLLTNNYDEAYRVITRVPEVNIELQKLATTCKLWKKKKPALAACMSGIIPGSGKIYAGDWKNGLLSLFIISANVWQAYRGFGKNGTKSAYGWIFSTIALTFYGGNIYGGYRAAKQYNQLQYESTVTKTRHILFNSD